MPLNLDYNHQTNIMIPTFKRDSLIRYDWMRLQSFPLITMNDNFDVDFNVQLFSAKHNNQVLSYEHYLNGVLNPINPIFITDGAGAEETYVYIRGELFSTPTYLYTRAEATPVFIYTRDEIDTQSIDFVIHLSGTDSALQTKLENFAEEFKPAGKIFAINIY